MKPTRLALIAFATLIIGGAGLGGYVWWKTRGARSIPHIAVTGGKPLSLRLPFHAPHFLQSDPRWQAEHIGHSQTETLGAVGCTLCSLTTAAITLGEDTDPPRLNKMLTAAGGFTPQNWLVWSAVGAVFEKRLEVVVHNSPSHSALDAALERGEYPLVKFFLPMGIPHWVLVVGKEGQEYLILDPALGRAEPLPLSTRATGIYSLRVVRKNS